MNRDKLEKFIEKETARIARDYNFTGRVLFYKDGRIGVQFTTNIINITHRITMLNVLTQDMLDTYSEEDITKFIEDLAEEVDDEEADLLVKEWIGV